MILKTNFLLYVNIYIYDIYICICICTFIYLSSGQKIVSYKIFRFLHARKGYSLIRRTFFKFVSFIFRDKTIVITKERKIERQKDIKKKKKRFQRVCVFDQLPSYTMRNYLVVVDCSWPGDLLFLEALKKLTSQKHDPFQ